MSSKKDESVSEYEKLLPYATTESQVLKIEALLEFGTQKKAAEALGINVRTFERSLANLRVQAEKRMQDERSVIGESVMTDGEGNVKLRWQKRQIGKQQQVEIYQEAMQSFIEGFKGKIKPKKYTKGKFDENLLTSFIVGDGHFGLLAWEESTGSENYDSLKAEEDTVNAFEYLISTAPKSQVGVIYNVGDLFHCNGLKPFTPESGHLLDTDGRMSKTIDHAMRAFRYAVDRALKKFPEVWVINQRGNHDPDGGMWFNKMMKIAYENEPRVTVFDNEQKMINFVWGKNLVSTHHGDRINFARWHEALVRDFREMWGQTTFAYGWQGHLHHEKKQEIGGCIFEVFPSLVAPDNWHAASGYGAGRCMTSITLHKEFGEVLRNKCSIDLIRAYE